MKTLFQCAGQFCGSARETGQGGGTERPNKNSFPLRSSRIELGLAVATRRRFWPAPTAHSTIFL